MVPRIESLVSGFEIRPLNDIYSCLCFRASHAMPIHRRRSIFASLHVRPWQLESKVQRAFLLRSVLWWE